MRSGSFCSRLSAGGLRRSEFGAGAGGLYRPALRYRIRFQDRLEVLEGALATGRQADVLIAEEVRSRLESVQQSATARTSVAHHLKFSKIEAWLLPTL
jgi:hypothetical protein